MMMTFRQSLPVVDQIWAGQCAAVLASPHQRIQRGHGLIRTLAGLFLLRLCIGDLHSPIDRSTLHRSRWNGRGWIKIRLANDFLWTLGGRVRGNE